MCHQTGLLILKAAVCRNQRGEGDGKLQMEQNLTVKVFLNDLLGFRLFCVNLHSASHFQSVYCLFLNLFCRCSYIFPRNAFNIQKGNDRNQTCCICWENWGMCHQKLLEVIYSHSFKQLKTVSYLVVFAEISQTQSTFEHWTARITAKHDSYVGWKTRCVHTTCSVSSTRALFINSKKTNTSYKYLQNLTK